LGLAVGRSLCGTVTGQTLCIGATRAARPFHRRLATTARSEAEDSTTGPSPEAWREFRAQLISGGLKLTTDEDTAESSPSQQSRRVVAPRNEELLKTQNQELWEEYINGAWAHLSPVEAGGLLCHQPVPAQLTYLMRRHETLKSACGEELLNRLKAELPEPVDGQDKESMLATWSQNTNYCYKLAESLIRGALSSVASRASGGTIDIRQLSSVERDLVIMYSRAQETWQQVCLVLKAESGSSAADEAVVINRPFAREVNKPLAEMLLNGRQSASAVNVPYSEEDIADCVKAFGEDAAVYVGGPNEQEGAGILVHGFDLPGASEIAPGVGIFVGGARAAIQGVLNGTFSPLDFRWFVGRHTALSSLRGEWRAVACARPIALKQCLGLPKPLWHEVMELCGGECADLSRLELLKRDDIEPEEQSADPTG